MSLFYKKMKLKHNKNEREEIMLFRFISLFAFYLLTYLFTYLILLVLIGFVVFFERFRRAL